MDLQHQQVILQLAERHGADKLVVVLGAPDVESAQLSAETVVLGDPTYAGALAEVQLGLDVYHVLEDEIRNEIPSDIWEEQIGIMADVLDGESIAAALGEIRSQRPQAVP
jgi:glycine/sarcosine/betaine reductase complex component A